MSMKRCIRVLVLNTRRKWDRAGTKGKCLWAWIIGVCTAMGTARAALFPLRAGMRNA